MTEIQIGAAQFGGIYGLTNGAKPMSLRESWEMLDFGLSNGVTHVDTAPDYGESLSVISNYRGGPLNITSKIKAAGKRLQDLNEMIDFQQEMLGKNHILENILIHDLATLSVREREFVRELSQARKDVSFGISVYEPWEIEQTLNQIGNIESIQFPINILNQLFMEFLNTPKRKGFLLIARSLMLQGALDWESKRNPFTKHKEIIQVREFANSLRMKPIEVVVAFAKQLNVDLLLIGFGSVQQFREFMDAWTSDLPSVIDFSRFNSNDLNLIDPRKW